MSYQSVIKERYVLSYFKLKGLAEPIRLLLVYGKIDFEDRRIPWEDWPKVKPTLPSKQLPVLQIGNRIMFQSIAICRYLGRKIGISGENAWEDAEIDMVVYNVTDLRLKVGSVFHDSNDTNKDNRYGTLLAETIPFHLKILEDLATANNGYLILKRLTWADFFFVGLVDYLNIMCLQDITANNPNLRNLVSNVRNFPAIKEWLANAPETEF